MTTTDMTTTEFNHQLESLVDALSEAIKTQAAAAHLSYDTLTTTRHCIIAGKLGEAYEHVVRGAELLREAAGIESK